MKQFVKNAVTSVSRSVEEANSQKHRQIHDLDLVLSAILARQEVEKLNDPVAFIAGIRECIEPMRCRIDPIKKPSGTQTDADKMFNGFTERLGAHVPPTAMQIALRFARVADEYRGNKVIALGKNRATEVSRHFAQSSSSGRKGRLLAAAVGHFKPNLTLELGTAYGISSLFMASVLRDLESDKPRKVVTVEGFEPQATLCRTLLEREFGDLIQCEFGLSNVSLPRLAASLKDIDLYFHDAGHMYDDYVNDVGVMLPAMAKGSILILDDIYWDDRRFTSTPSRAHEGWLAVVANPRVRAAAEIDREIGIALID